MMNESKSETPSKARGKKVFTDTFIPICLDEAGLTAAQFRVWCRVSRRGKCIESIPNMAKGCRMHPNTVGNALKKLLSMRLLKKTSRPGDTDIYEVTNPTQPTQNITTPPQNNMGVPPQNNGYEGTQYEGTQEKVPKKTETETVDSASQATLNTTCSLNSFSSDSMDIEEKRTSKPLEEIPVAVAPLAQTPPPPSKPQKKLKSLRRPPSVADVIRRRLSRQGHGEYGSTRAAYKDGFVAQLLQTMCSRSADLDIPADGIIADVWSNDAYGCNEKERNEIIYELRWSFRFIHFNNRKGWPLSSWEAASDGFNDEKCSYGVGPADVPHGWTPHIDYAGVEAEV